MRYASSPHVLMRLLCGSCFLLATMLCSVRAATPEAATRATFGGELIKRLPPPAKPASPRPDNRSAKQPSPVPAVAQSRPTSIPIAKPIRPAPSVQLSLAPAKTARPVSPTVNQAAFVDDDGAALAEESILPDELTTLGLPREVTMQANRIMEEAVQLADRGALFAARNRFLRAMRMVTQTLDAQVGRTYHTRALVRGLRALDEAGDFAAESDFVEDDLHLAGFIAGHDTPVLKDVAPSAITPLTAMQTYYDYAHRQLVRAGAGQSVASQALFAMGRAESLIGSNSGGNQHISGPKAMALYHAAVNVDPSNARAANELAVILDRAGHHERAIATLEQIARLNPTAAVLQNLASLYHRTGRWEQSRQVARRSQQLAMAGSKTATNGVPQIHWVTPQAFAQTPSAVDPVNHAQPIVVPVPPRRRPALTRPTPPARAVPTGSPRTRPSRPAGAAPANWW